MMETFVAAYLAVWLGVMLYVGRMGMRQRRLQRSLDALQAQLSPDTDDHQTPAKSA